MVNVLSIYRVLVVPVLLYWFVCKGLFSLTISVWMIADARLDLFYERPSSQAALLLLPG